MKAFYLSIVILTCGSVAYAQVGIGTTTPNPNAVLELVSPGKNQGFLVPRLTTAQRSALSLSASDNGLMVYDSDENRFYYWHASQWLPLRSGNDVTLEAGSGIEITGNTISAVPDGDGDATNEIQDLELTGNELRITNNESATVIDLTPFTDADGDPTNEIQDLQLVGNTLSITNNASATTIDLAPYAGTNTDNQTLSYDGSTGALDITGGNSVTITPAGPAGGILTGNYPNPDLATTQEAGNNVISAINVASTTINANRLQGTVVLQSESPTGGAISGTFAGGLQINDNAVTTAKINNAAVTNAKIADGAVGTTKIADGAVTNTKIADGTIIGAKIADGSITSADLSTTGVAAGTYGAANTVPQISVDSKGRVTDVTPVTISGVAPGGAAGGDLAGTYPLPTIASGAGSNIVTAINSGTTTGTINTNRLATTVVLDSESPAAAGDVSGSFNAGLIIGDGKVTSAKIADGTVATNDIANLAVTDAKIASGISPGKISPSTTNNQVLTTVGGATVWANVPAGTVTSITAGTGLSGGTITTTGTIALSNTGVATGTYGSATTVPRITVDAQGRLTAVSSVTISTGGGSIEGLAETLKESPDAKGEIAYNLGSVSIGDWGGGKGEGGPGPGALNVNGSHYRSFVVLPADMPYDVRDTDYILVGPADAQKPIVVNLPDATKQPGRILVVRATNTNPSYFVQLTPLVSGQKIDGDTESERLYYYYGPNNTNHAYALTVMSDGKNWWSIDRSIPPGREGK